MMMRSMCRPETEDRNSAGTHKPSYVLEVPIIPWENTFCESNEKTNDFDDSRLAIACAAHIGSGCVLATRFSPVHLVHLHKRRSNCTLTGLHFVCGRREWERKRERTWIPNRQNNNMNEWTNERQTKLTGQAVCAYPMCTMCIFFVQNGMVTTLSPSKMAGGEELGKAEQIHKMHIAKKRVAACGRSFPNPECEKKIWIILTHNMHSVTLCMQCVK